jgi:hypothetical protein
MEKMEAIANQTAEHFINKHFIKLDKKDLLVKEIRNSVRETIKNALVRYESERA